MRQYCHTCSLVVRGVALRNLQGKNFKAGGTLEGEGSWEGGGGWPGLAGDLAGEAHDPARDCPCHEAVTAT